MREPHRSLVRSIAIIVLIAGGCTTSTGSIELVSATEAAASLAAAPDQVVLDVRTAEEFESGHLAGAINIDFYAADFRNLLDELNKDTSYVLYCRSGNRSAETSRVMGELQFTAVDEIEGGILAWLDAGLPLVARR